MQEKRDDNSALTPLAHAVAERAKIRLAATRAQLKEDQDDVSMDLEMEKLGLSERTDGKANTTNRIHKHTQSKSRLMQNLQDYAFGLASAAASFNAMFKSVADMAYHFGQDFAAAQNAHTHGVLKPLAPAQDSLYYYDTVLVSAGAAQILNNEAAIVEDLVQELRAQTDPVKIANLTMQLEDLTKYYNMRPHPVTGLYVHLYDEIERIETLYNPHGTLQAMGSVCFYCPLADKANLRGMKIVVTDVYDQNPQEVQLAQQNMADLKAHAPAPSLHHT